MPDRLATARTAPSSIQDVAAVIDFEARGLIAGQKEVAIRREFGVTPARYFQRLHAVVRTPEAIARNPMLCHRVIDALEARSRSRAGAGPTRERGTT